jgi:hypothetical protein
MKICAFIIEVEVAMNESRPTFDQGEIDYLRATLRGAVQAALTQEFEAEQPQDSVKIERIRIGFTARWKRG